MSHQQLDFKPSDLLKEGWCQGAYYLKHNGQIIARCARQAIADAPLTNDEWINLMNSLGALLDGEDLRFWNDRCGQTEQNVIATMEEAERKAKIK